MPIHTYSRGALWLIAAGLISPYALSADYYVAPDGDNNHPGSITEPWETLQHAAGQMLPGDQLHVRAGNYAGMHLTTSGTAASSIRIGPYNGETVVIDTDNPITPDGINLEGASYVIVEGLRVEGATRAGIRAVLCEHVRIGNNEVIDNGRWGIFTGFCDDLLIHDNVASGSVDEHGIYVSNSGDRPIIRDNIIFNNHANGIHANGDISQGGDGIISEAVIERNIIFNNGEAGGSAINLDGVQDSVIRNNLIYATHASGISLYQIDGGGASTNNRVLNNTVLVASDGRWALNIQNGSTGNQVFNNILYSAHNFRGSIDIDADALVGFVSDHNLVMDRFTIDGGNSIIDLADWQALGQDLNSAVSTPELIFVDPGIDNYHPAPEGPAVDTGLILGDVTDDLNRNPRPAGASHDIGAYEHFAGIFADRFE